MFSDNNINLFVPEELDLQTTPILPGIYAIETYGHTPGHTAYMIGKDEERLLI